VYYSALPDRYGENQPRGEGFLLLIAISRSCSYQLIAQMAGQVDQSLPHLPGVENSRMKARDTQKAFTSVGRDM
jgi:hypothetical protein